MTRFQAWLNERDADLIRKTNYGIQIRTAPVNIIQLINELSNQNDYFLYLSPAERIDVLILMLLRGAETSVPPDKIERVLGISRPTLNKDVNKARRWLDKFSLSLSYKPHIGFQVEGSESNWREAMVTLFVSKIGVVSLLALGDSPTKQPDIKTGSHLKFVNTMLTETLRTLDLKTAASFVKQLEDKLHKHFVDVAFVRLVCHYALAIFRSGHNKSIELTGGISEIPDENEELTAIKELLVSMPVSLQDTEINMFCRQVLGAKIQHSRSELIQPHQILSGQMETHEIVQHIVDDASLYLHPSLKVDQQLICALSMHIQVAKNRLRYGLPIDNPLQEAVEAQFPHIIGVVQNSIATLNDQTYKQVPSEEVAYLAMHLGAAMERMRPYQGLKRKVWIVCGEGMATAWLLVARLQAEFPEIIVDEVISVIKITENPPRTSQVDLVLTTLPLIIPDVLTLEVSPLLTHEDQVRIHTILSHGPARRMVGPSSDNHEGLSLSDLLTEDTVRLGVKVENWEGVIDAVGELLLNVQAVSSRYIEAMKEAVYRYGPYVVLAPGIALLHARPDDGVNRICLSLVTLNPPIQFHHPHNDPVRLAFGICMVDHHSHLKALAELANLLGDSERISKIEFASSTAEIISTIARQA